VAGEDVPEAKGRREHRIRDGEVVPDCELCVVRQQQLLQLRERREECAQLGLLVAAAVEDREGERVRLVGECVDEGAYTRARSTGSFGSRPESGYRSAMNSSMTSDSAILADSADGCSGSDLGLPYNKAGTLPAGFTLEANHSGLFLGLIEYLVTSALAS